MGKSTDLLEWGGVEKQTGTGMQTGAATRLSQAINQSGQKASNRQRRRINLSPGLGFRMSSERERKKRNERGKTEVTCIETPSVAICMSLEKKEKGKRNNVG